MIQEARFALSSLSSSRRGLLITILGSRPFSSRDPPPQTLPKPFSSGLHLLLSVSLLYKMTADFLPNALIPCWNLSLKCIYMWTRCFTRVIHLLDVAWISTVYQVRVQVLEIQYWRVCALWYLTAWWMQETSKQAIIVQCGTCQDNWAVIAVGPVRQGTSHSHAGG